LLFHRNLIAPFIQYMALSVQSVLLVLFLSVAAGTTLPWPDPTPNEKCPVDGHETEDDVTSLIQNHLSVQSNKPNVEGLTTHEGTQLPGHRLLSQTKLKALAAEMKAMDAAMKSENITSLHLVDMQTKNKISQGFSKRSLKFREMIQNNASWASAWAWMWGGIETAFDYVFDVFGHETSEFLKSMFGSDVEPLIECIDRLEEHQQLDGMLKFVIREGSLLKGGIANLGEQLHEVYIKPPLEEIEGWLGTQDQAASDDAEVEDSAGTFEIIDHAWSKLKELANLPHMEQLNCIVVHVLDPLYINIRDSIGNVLLGIDLTFRALWQVLVNFGLAPMVEGLLGGVKAHITSQNLAGDITHFAKIEASSRCQNRIHSMKDALAAFVRTDNPDRSQASALANVDKVEDEMADIIVVALHQWSHDFIPDFVDIQIGKELYKWAGAAVDLMGQALHTLDGILGLIPEIGAGISALFTSAATTIMEWAVPVLVQGSLELMKMGILSVMDTMYSQVSSFVNDGLTITVAEGLGEMFKPFVPIVELVVDAFVSGVRPIAQECDGFLGNIAVMVEKACSVEGRGCGLER